MRLKVPSSIVSVQWLFEHIENENLVVLDATIQKVGTKEEAKNIKQQIKNAVFFDLKNVFLNKKGAYPNTIPLETDFEREVRKLGIDQESCIVVYDDLGMYSSPRVWWLFKLFGFENIAVLNGGLPKWIKEGQEVFPIKEIKQKEGNFRASYNKELFADTDMVLHSISKGLTILDARSKGRFEATSPEPRADLRGGHIPTSISLPYTALQEKGKMNSLAELKKLFSDRNPKGEEMIFTCGSGITACVLALAAEVCGYKKFRVYDGSWTEWGSRLDLPIEK